MPCSALLSAAGAPSITEPCRRIGRWNMRRAADQAGKCGDERQEGHLTAWRVNARTPSEAWTNERTGRLNSNQNALSDGPILSARRRPGSPDDGPVRCGRAADAEEVKTDVARVETSCCGRRVAQQAGGEFACLDAADPYERRTQDDTECPMDWGEMSRQPRLLQLETNQILPVWPRGRSRICRSFLCHETSACSTKSQMPCATAR